MLRLVGAGGALLALAITVAISFSTNTANAASAPGLNGRIACEANRRTLTIPSPNPNAISPAEITSVNPDGSGEDVLTDNVTRDGDPAYSPDGTKIAFEGRRVPGQPDNSEIYVANNDGDLEGPDVKRLTFNNGERTGLTRSQVAATDRSPSWSPDGKQIVFHSGREATFTDGGTTPINDFEIYKMNAETGEHGGIQRLTSVRGQDAIPHWSPAGNKITFQTLREGTTERNQNLEVYTMNPDGSGQTNVSQSPGSANIPATPGNDNSNGLDRDPQFSPDGQQITFSSTRSNVTPGNQNFEVFKMNADGSGQVRLTSNLSGDTPAPGAFADYDSSPSFSPDGTRIVFTSSRASTPGGEDFAAYTMSSTVGEPGGLQRVTATGVQFGKCDWQALPRSVAPTPRATYPQPYTNPPRLFADCPSTSATVIPGTAGNDNLTGTVAGDRIFGGPGNDAARGLAGDDCVDLGPGVDSGDGGVGNDLMLGGLGNDRIVGGAGRDVINGNPDNDRLDGGSGSDRLFGDSGNDSVNGGSGNDRLHGVRGNDRVSGSSGRDRINGGAGTDRIGGGSSGDRIAGDQGNDRISGNSGNDSLKGNSGADRINGGSGRDSLSGGIGNDRISARDRKRDRITCGKGRDSVTADRVDRVSRDCERVRRR